jgi:hypothetical protein
MKDTGKMIKLTDLGNYIMQMEIFTRVIGEKTKQTGRGLICMQTGQNIKVIGRMINSMGLV